MYACAYTYTYIYIHIHTYLFVYTHIDGCSRLHLNPLQNRTRPRGFSHGPIVEVHSVVTIPFTVFQPRIRPMVPQKAPCSFIVNTWALKGLPYHDFWGLCIYHKATWILWGTSSGLSRGTKHPADSLRLLAEVMPRGCHRDQLRRASPCILL